MTADNDNDNEPPPATDDEGLLLEYDVVICGTGLTQSILACALARAGKSVLHCDSQSFYGELDAGLTLAQVMEQGEGELWSKAATAEAAKAEEEPNTMPLQPHPPLEFVSTRRLETMNYQVGTVVTTPYGQGSVMSLPSQGKNLAISLDDWVLANETSPVLYVGGDDDPDQTDIQPLLWLQSQRVLGQQSRSFALDLSPYLIFASGVAVDGFLTSGVADYLEFKSVQALLWFNENDGTLDKVPCSKGDVFSSKLLPPLDKRRLMKFMHLIMDYGTALQLKQDASVDNDDSRGPNDKHDLNNQVQSLNEVHLNQGRSLARPQNKAVSTSDLDSLQSIMQENKLSLCDYLTQHHKLSPQLVSIMRHGLALDMSSNGEELSVRHGMTRIIEHLQGLGRFGSTAFLTPLYGSGEFSQAFCRSAAVHGGTYLLRRRPKSIVLSSDDKRVKGVVLCNDENATEKLISCRHVVTSQHAIAAPADSFKNTKRILRRISIIVGKVVPDSDEQRHVIVFPPDCINNNACAIYGLVLDWHARVAAPGCCLLHLSTTVQSDDEHNNNVVLDKAAKSLLEGVGTGGEIYQVTFSYPIVDKTSHYNDMQGLHVCPCSHELTADHYFANAKSLFNEICPGADFLVLSEEMDSAIREQQQVVGGTNNEDDEERMVLDSAVNMIDKKAKAKDIS